MTMLPSGPIEVRPRVHVWTIAEIQKLPEFGGDNGWFYGLVEDFYTDSDEDGHDPWVLGEIYGGTGYTLVDRTDDVQWSQVIQDLTHYSPATFKERT